ncbi:MAG TPA: aldehyde dehydrogenase family protein [Terriglobales bacterium]|nr:aldehyde dehydrogenase family protein [Terriglobales bacterium]
MVAMDSAARTFHNLIAGEWREPLSGEYLENRNPARRGELIGLFPRSNAEDVELAVAAAAEAYRRWRATPAPRRAELLFRAGQILIENKQSYARDMTREMGKVLLETGGDVQEAIDMLFFMAGEGRRLYGATTPSELPNKACLTARVPLGVAGLITPWNFPMAIPSWKIVPALICGNTVVLKPAEDTPLSAVNFVNALIEAGVPNGVVNLVMGTGPECGAPLAAHPGTRIISFTGSTEVGRQVGQQAARLFKHCNLELGGKNAIIVLDDADLELAVDGALWGAFGTSGQRCTAASRLIVQKGIHGKFVERLTERAARLKVGDGLDPNTQVGPLINQEQLETVERYVEIGRGEGAKLRLGGARMEEGELAQGYFFAPTIFTDCAPEMRIAQEEIFGPVVSVLACEDLESALEIANGVSYGLSASIYTRDVNAAMRAARDLETGIVYINAPTIGAEVHLPFGGTKNTGNGHRESGLATLDVYSEWKTIYVDYSGALQRAQID